MRAESLRALAAQYRSLDTTYPGFGYGQTAEQFQAEAVKLEAEWAAQDEEKAND